MPLFSYIFAAFLYKLFRIFQIVLLRYSKDTYSCNIITNLLRFTSFYKLRCYSSVLSAIGVTINKPRLTTWLDRQMAGWRSNRRPSLWQAQLWGDVARPADNFLVPWESYASSHNICSIFNTNSFLFIEADTWQLSNCNYIRFARRGQRNINMRRPCKRCCSHGMTGLYFALILLWLLRIYAFKKPETWNTVHDKHIIRNSRKVNNLQLLVFFYPIWHSILSQQAYNNGSQTDYANFVLLTLNNITKQFDAHVCFSWHQRICKQFYLHNTYIHWTYRLTWHK